MKKEDEPFVITVIQDVANISSLVNMFFKDDKKTAQWLNTENPLLGHQEPIEMIFKGRTKKLKKFLLSQLEENGIL